MMGTKYNERNALFFDDLIKLFDPIFVIMGRYFLYILAILVLTAHELFVAFDLPKFLG